MNNIHGSSNKNACIIAKYVFVFCFCFLFLNDSSTRPPLCFILGLQLDWKDATTKLALSYAFVVHGNGTILQVKSGARLLTPIKQFFRPTIGPVKSDDEGVKAVDGHDLANKHTSIEPAAQPVRGVVTATCHNASDCTAELQAAFASGAAHVHVPKLPGGRAWIVRPLTLGSHQTITLAAGVEILAKRRAFQSRYTGLLSARGVRNLTIEGGAGSVLRMRRADYANASAAQGIVYAKSEWRHGITLIGVDGVIIRGPSSPTPLSICAALALLTALVNPRALHRCGTRTFKSSLLATQEESGPEMPPENDFPRPADHRNRRRRHRDCQLREGGLCGSGHGERQRPGREL